jgi:hypothetical protein
MFQRWCLGASAGGRRWWVHVLCLYSAACTIPNNPQIRDHDRRICVCALYYITLYNITLYSEWLCVCMYVFVYCVRVCLCVFHVFVYDYVHVHVYLPQVSWVVQMIAEGQLTGVRMRGGVFLSGGSYNCYTPPPLARGVCTNCNASTKCRRSVQPSCLTQTVAKDALCCSYCCPTGFAEEYYVDHPEEWPQHPPAFLAQLTGFDFNADLCATTHYHNTLQAHGIESTLILDSVHDSAHCFCGGDPTDLTAAGAAIYIRDRSLLSTLH